MRVVLKEVGKRGGVGSIHVVFENKGHWSVKAICFSLQFYGMYSLSDIL